MGDTSKTTTSTSQPANPMVTGSLDKLLGQFNGAIDKGAPAQFGQSLYSPMGKLTQQGIASGYEQAINPKFWDQLSGAFGNNKSLIASGGLNPAQQQASGNVNSVAGQLGGMAQNGGLTQPQQQNINAVSQVGSKLGALSDTYRQPGLYEQTMLGTARGNNLNGNDPLFERDLGRTLDTAGAGVNAGIGAGGRYGSNLHVDTLARTLGGIDDAARLKERNSALDRQQQALAGITGERQAGIGNQFNALLGKQGAAQTGFGLQQQGNDNRFNALSGQLGANNTRFNMEQGGIGNAMTGGQNLASLFQTGLLPSATLQGVGGQQDADKQAQLLAQANLFNSGQNANTDWLAKLSSIFGGTAPFGGTQSSTTQPGPNPWLSLLGGGTALASAFL